METQISSSLCAIILLSFLNLQLAESCDAHEYCLFHYFGNVHNIPAISIAESRFDRPNALHGRIRYLGSCHLLCIWPMGLSCAWCPRIAAAHRIFHCNFDIRTEFLFSRRIFQQQNLGNRTETIEIVWKEA